VFCFREDGASNSPSFHARAHARENQTRRLLVLAAKRTGLPQRRGIASPSPLNIRDFTNGRGSDVDAPIRHAKPDRRTHTQEVPHTRAVPHRPDIHQPPLAAALQ
jgi:hypothetical protein